MRILASMFHPKGFWPYTGSERRFCALSQQWKEMGLETLALEPDPIARDKIPAGYVPLRVPVSGLSLAHQGASWFIRAVRLGIFASKKSPFDLVYSTNNNVFNLAVSYAIATVLSVPCIAVVHHLRWVDYRDIQEGATDGRPNFSRFLRFLRDEGVGVGGAIARVMGGYIESKFLPRFDGFIVVSGPVESQLAMLVSSRKIFVGENAPFNSKTTLGSMHPRGMTALSVGRIDEGKGTIELLGTWKKVVEQCPIARLEIAGDGSLRKRMVTEASRQGLDRNLRFWGFLDDDEIVKLQSQSRLFVTLSRTEGFGMAIAEALAAGLPVVAWDTPPLREIFGDCPAVFLCHQGNSREVISTAVRLLTIPEDHWEELSAQATNYSRRFSWRRAAEKELQVLERVRRD